MATLIPVILIGVPISSKCGTSVSTVTVVVGVVPSPEIILEIAIGSDASAPTISHSVLCLSKSPIWSGHWNAIGLLVLGPKAWVNL